MGQALRSVPFFCGGNVEGKESCREAQGPQGGQSESIWTRSRSVKNAAVLGLHNTQPKDRRF